MLGEGGGVGGHHRGDMAKSMMSQPSDPHDRMTEGLTERVTRIDRTGDSDRRRARGERPGERPKYRVRATEATE